MRLTIFAAALLVGTAAIAQSNDPGMSPPDATAAPDAAMPAPDSSMPATPPADQSMPAQPPAGQPMAPDASTPSSADSSMTPPAGGGMAGSSATTPMPSTTDYPVCSRTVTDKCINPSSAPRHRMHKPR